MLKLRNVQLGSKRLRQKPTLGKISIEAINRERLQPQRFLIRLTDLLRVAVNEGLRQLPHILGRPHLVKAATGLPLKLLVELTASSKLQNQVNPGKG